MGDANAICTLGDYSKPSHEGYRNTIELPVGNNVVPLRSDTIRENREKTRLHLFQFSFRDQASKWLERHQVESITTWEDLTTRFLAQFFPSGRTAKLRNDILMFQQHHGESLSEAWTHFKDLIQNVPHHGIDLWLKVQIFYDHVTPVTRRTINKSAGGKLHDKNAEESYALLEDLAFYDNENDMISKINLLWKAVSEKLDDTPIRDTAGNPAAQMNFTSTNDPTREELQGKGIKSPSKLLSPKYLSQSSLAEQNRNPSSPKRVHFVNSIVILNKEDEAKEEGNVKTSTTEYEDHEMTVESEEEFEEETEDEIKEEEEDSPKHFDTFPTMKELRYHEWLLKNPRPPWVKAKVRTGNLNNVKFSCMIGHFDKKQAYLDMESPINVMSRLHYNWIMSKRLGPRRKPSNPGKICNFVGRVKGLKVFVGNFTYECDFMVLEDTTSVIDHDLGSVIFGKPFVEATGLVYDKEEGTITFKKDKEKIVAFIQEITNKIACRKFLIKNEEEIFTVPGDGVRIKTDDVASPAM
ncbi:MAK10-like protein [Tanacetum coccineum]